MLDRMEQISVTAVVPFMYRAEREVRTAIGPDGEPWFVLADLCTVLEVKNVSQTRARLDQDEVATTRLDNAGGVGNPNATVVSEAGMYELVLTSRTDEAVSLRRWITHDVLPAIRAHGEYLTDERKRIVAGYAVRLRRSVKLATVGMDHRDQSKGRAMVRQAIDEIGFEFGSQWLEAMAGPDAVAEATRQLESGDDYRANYPDDFTPTT